MVTPRKSKAVAIAKPKEEPTKRFSTFNREHPQARYEYLQNPNGQQPQTSFIYVDPKFTFLGIERLRSYAEGVSYQQNDPIIASCLSDLANLVVGAKGGKMVCSGHDKSAEINKFLKSWSRSASWRDRQSLNDLLWTTVIVSNRDGDCLWVCDKDLTDGKILVYESDQIVNVDNFNAWADKYPEIAGGKQIDGVVFDKNGKLSGYNTTTRRASQTVPNSDAVFVPSSKCYLHVPERYRANQHRGESKLLSLMTILQSNRKMLESTVISAQRAAEDILVKKIKNPVSDILNQEQQNQFGVQSYNDGYTPIGGGEIVVGTDDSVEMLKNEKPEGTVTDFGDWFRRVVYRRFGMTDVFANGKCETKDQGKSEMILAHITISAYQERLEGLVEWAAKTALDAAGIVPSDEWTDIDILWPELPTAEFDLTQADKIARLRIGASSFSAEYGADWESRAKQFAEERNMLKEMGLESLDIFSTVAGKNTEMDKQKKETK